MCGIVGYIGPRQAVEFLVSGLHRLEYRGYDSAGVATINAGGTLDVVKSAGRIDRLEKMLAETPVSGSVGIGHTRWATHGAPNDVNAHPHIGDNGTLALVHNGVIENFRSIKQRLENEGYKFCSNTDTEVIAHLIDSCLKAATDRRRHGRRALPALGCGGADGLGSASRARTDWRLFSAIGRT